MRISDWSSDVCSSDLRMRVALASLLFQAPDLLLLDEPTNHLDLEAALWLEGFLKSYPGTLLLVSHDRGLLNRAVNRIIHVENRKLTAYTGNYDRFEQLRREHLERQAALRSEEHTSELQSLMRTSYDVFCLKK